MQRPTYLPVIPLSTQEAKLARKSLKELLKTKSIKEAIDEEAHRLTDWEGAKTATSRQFARNLSILFAPEDIRAYVAATFMRRLR